jgi:hypothetical protein
MGRWGVKNFKRVSESETILGYHGAGEDEFPP